MEQRGGISAWEDEYSRRCSGILSGNSATFLTFLTFRSMVSAQNYLLATMRRADVLTLTLARAANTSFASEAHLTSCHKPPAPSLSGRDTDGLRGQRRRGGGRRYLSGTGGARHSKEHLASNPSPKHERRLILNERFALLLQLPALAMPTNMV